MEIVIEDNNAYQNSIQMYAATWRYYGKHIFGRKIILLCLRGICLVFIGMLIGNSVMTTGNVANGREQQHVTSYYLQTGVALGTVFLLLALGAILRVILFDKPKYLNNYTRQMQTSLYPENKIVIKVNGTGVTYTTCNQHLELKWLMFKNYALYEHYVALNYGQQRVIIIDKRMLNIADNAALQHFISQLPLAYKGMGQ